MSDPPAPADGELPAGRVLGGHYRIEERIGAGSMGVVYRARHTLLHRDFAAKVLAPSLAGDTEARRRFLREAEGMARITHPNVVPVRHFGEEDGLLYLVMDLCDGETLAALLAREGALPERRAVRVALQVLQALDAAHWEGVVHRDLKPANIVVTPGAAEREGGERVRVVDFGLARVAESKALPGSQTSAPGTVAGTVAYMSPEQVRGDADLDARSDLFSLGAVLHEMLGGRPPFDGPSTLTVAMKILEQTPAPLPEEGPRGVSAPVRAVLARALEKDRERRFRTAGEMADALRDALAGVAPAGAPEVLAPRKRAAVIAGSALAILLPFAIAAMILLDASPGETPPSPPPYAAADAAADRDRALRLLLDARFEAAAAAAGRVVASGLGGAEDDLLLGRARAGTGDPRALDDLRRAETRLGPDPRPATERARFRIDEEADLAAAERDLDAVLARGPDRDALFERARALQRRVGDARGAAAAPGLAALRATAEALGDDPRRGVVEALGEWARGEHEAARVRAQRASDDHPDLAEAAFMNACVCLGLGTRERLPGAADEARRWYERSLLAIGDCIARARRRPDLHLQGRDLLRYWRTSCTVKYALGDTEGAAADYVNEILARNPGCVRDLGVGAQYLQWAGRFEEALRSYEGARRAGAGEIHLHGEGFCHMQIGRMRAEVGDLPGALRALEESVAKFTAGSALRPDEPAFRSYRAEAWLTRARLQRDEAAAAALAKAKEDFDALEAAGKAGDPEVLFRRWEYHEATGDGAAALADIRKAVALQDGQNASYHRRLAFSCVAGAAAVDGAALLEEAVRATDEAEKWSPRRAELACILRGDARAALAARPERAGERAGLLAAAGKDYAKAAALARLDSRVQAEARLRAAGALLAAGDAAGAVSEAEYAMLLRKEANAANRSSLFVNDYYLRSPLAAFHARLAEALTAAGKPEDAAREEAKARALR